jgi:hypothetical protein
MKSIIKQLYEDLQMAIKSRLNKGQPTSEYVMCSNDTSLVVI